MRVLARLALALVLVSNAAVLGQNPPAQVPPAQVAPVQGPPAPQSKPKEPTPIVVAIHVEGNRRFTEEQLRDALGQKIGEPLDMDVIDKNLKTIWDAFKTMAHVVYRPVQGGVELKLIVEEMNADLEPRFIGNSNIKVDVLKKWARLEDKSELFLFQAEQVKQRLLEGYRREGYAFAEVDVVRRGAESGPIREGELPDVIFEIREGPQVRVKDFIVHGAKSMPETGMWWWRGGLTKLAKVELGGPWLFNWKGDKFVQDTLDADLLAMRDVYRDRGYLDAVVELDHLQYSLDHSGVVIHVIVDEGQPYRVRSLHIEAVNRKFDVPTKDYIESKADLIFPEAELLKLCKLQPGKRYERSVQSNDGIALRDYYGSRGYIAHPSLRENYFEFLDPRFTYDPDTHQLDVTYKIAQGEKRWVHEVLFEGAEHTRDRVVRREVDVMPGEVADLTKIRKSLGHLYSTSYFNDDTAPLEHRDPTFSFRPLTDPRLVDLLYKVEEGRVINLILQGGIDSNSGLFGRIGLSMRNFDIADPPRSPWTTFSDIYTKEAFHGAGQRLDLDWSPGTVVNQYRARFLEPDIFRSHFDRYSLELELLRRMRTERFYEEDRNERRIRIGREFGRELAVFLGYTNTTVRVADVDSPLTGLPGPFSTPLPDSIYPEIGSHILSGLTLDAQYRNTDQFLNPREGLNATWRNGFFTSGLGSEFDYTRSEVDVDAFWQVGNSEEDVRPGFHVGFNVGVTRAFGDTDSTPYTERFFAGGSHSLRGFAYRGVGPNKGDNPLGGQTICDTTIEYHLPVYKITQPGTYKEIEAFRVTFFSDQGVLGPEPFQLDANDVRWSVGFGLGMVYPFPLQLNFGFPQRTGPGDRTQTFSFTLLNLSF